MPNLLAGLYTCLPLQGPCLLLTIFLAALPPCVCTCARAVCRYAKSLDASKFSRPSALQLAGSSGGGKAGKEKEGESHRFISA